MPIGARPHNFWAELECAFLNTLQARYQYVSESLGFGFAQGKTMLFRRDIVERGGGIRALAADTAEDAATTKMVRVARASRASGRHRIRAAARMAAAPEVWSRQLRWARLRRASFPWLFLPEIFLGSALPAVAVAVAAAGYGLSIPIAVAALLAVWYAAETGAGGCAGWHSLGAIGNGVAGSRPAAARSLACRAVRGRFRVARQPDDGRKNRRRRNIAAEGPNRPAPQVTGP